MMKHLLTIGLLLLAAINPVSANTVDPRDPQTIIEETSAHLFAILDGRREEFATDPALLRSLVSDELIPLMDLDYSARLSTVVCAWAAMCHSLCVRNCPVPRQRHTLVREFA